jgi:ubiquinone/menaquinone biosynthesis C-methylase UbiE
VSAQQFGETYGGTPPANYERFFVPAIGEPLAKDLVALAKPRRGDRVLDVACGTGIVARLAAKEVGPTGGVTGLDVNPGMLAVARSATPEGVTIEWIEADAAAIPLPDASFDIVFCQMGIQFMQDVPAALREMKRVLARDGRVALSVPGPAPQLFETLAESLATHAGAEAAGFVKRVFSIHDEEKIQGLLGEAGFKDPFVQSDTRTLRLPPAAEFLWQYLSSTPLAIALSQVDDERKKSLERDVLEKWERLKNDGSLDLKVRIVTATARS